MQEEFESVFETDNESLENRDALNRVAACMPAEEQLMALADFYKVMGDPNRLKLLMALEKNEFCASDLADLAGMSRSAVSHALKALKAAKLVKSRKAGKAVIYELDDDHIHSVINVAFEHIQEQD